MPVSDISELNYKILCESGVMTKLRLETLTLFKLHGPCTSKEALQKLNRIDSNFCSQIRSRVTYLRDAGQLRCTQRRKCTISGYLAYEYEYTGDAFIPPEPKESAKKKIERLEVEITRLNRVINYLVGTLKIYAQWEDFGHIARETLKELGLE